eukprot:TRINITY_DN2306_c0_g1_i1.p1 TRINITY_DN2306_c0_g1~~TRINITY_DN2306_c0_g1_i1.p1  ORF type:complete len:459 (+),score=159.56 TRINITY_DN2306_c0_g1_i1:136-1512(+)
MSSVISSSITSARAGVLPRGTRVEVFDEGQWHKGGKILSFRWETNEYVITWDGFDETTMAGKHEVRRAVTEWKRVKHPEGFRVDCKKAPYNDWLESQLGTRPSGRPVHQHNDPRSSLEESSVSSVPWVVPSSKNVVIPEWKSEFHAPHKKPKPHWEKRVHKHMKSSTLKDRPTFGVANKRQAWEDWKTDRPPVEPRDHSLSDRQDKKLQKYWGRFAPADAFSDGEGDDDTAPPPPREKPARAPAVKKQAAKKAAPAPPAPEHVEEDHDEPAEEEEEEAVMSDRIAPQEDPVAEEELNGGGDERGVADEQFPPFEALLADSDDGEYARESVFRSLVIEDAAEVSQESLEEKIGTIMGAESDNVSDGVALALAAVGAEHPSLPFDSFLPFLHGMERYRMLKGLYPEGTELSDKVEPEQFEVAIPLLAKWGVDMSDIEDAFTADEEITFNTFFAWAVKQDK